MQVEVPIVIKCSWSFAKREKSKGGDMVLVKTAEIAGAKDDIIMK